MSKLIWSCLLFGVAMSPMATQALALNDWLAGDYNLDGVISEEDYDVWLGAYGSTYSPPSRAVSTINITAHGQGAVGTIDIGADTIIIETIDRTRRSHDGEYTIDIFDSGTGGLSLSGSDKAIQVDLGESTSTTAQLATAIQGDSRFVTSVSGRGIVNIGVRDSGARGDLIGSQVASTDTIALVTREKTDKFNETGFEIVLDDTLASNTSSAAYDSDLDVIQLSIHGDQTYAQITTTIQTDLGRMFHAAARIGTGTINGSSQSQAQAALHASRPILVTPGVSADPLTGDGNFDGVVDIADYWIWRDAYAVPEPSAGLLCLLTLSSAGLRRSSYRF